MKKIIGRGVLLLETTPDGSGLKFGYQLGSEGIQLFSLGEAPALLSLSQAVQRSPLNAASSVTGRGQIMLNALPASPNDAFYNVSFNATQIGTNAESFTLRVQESGVFAPGDQSHFSGLDLTFQFSKNGGISIPTGGTISLHLDKGVFSNGQTIQLIPGWKAASETLVFTAADATQIPVDSIGHLSKIMVELDPAYDRWAQLMGLYAFDGGLTPKTTPAIREVAAHDISGQGAPSLFVEGAKNNNNPNDPAGAVWTDKGVALGGAGILANLEKIPNSIVDSIQESESFSVELWIKPAQLLQEGPAQIFSIESSPNSSRKFFFLGHGPWTDGNFKKEAGSPAGSYLNVNYGPVRNEIPMIRPPYWQNPFISPANSLSDTPAHIVYTYDQGTGTQRIFINGTQIAQKFDPGNYNDWTGNLRIAVGNNLGKNRPWKGEIYQLAIFNRALTAEEVDQHYRPILKITGDFSFVDSNVIPPLKGAFFPFNLSIGKEASTLTAARAVDMDFNPGLGFRHVSLECTKSMLPDSAWMLSGKFQTRFWEDLIPMNAGLNETNQLVLTSGEHPESGMDPLVLENALPGERALRLSSPQLTLTEPVLLEGTLLNEKKEFTSDKQFIWNWKHAADYYVTKETSGLPGIHLGASMDKAKTIVSILPRIFTTDKAFTSPETKRPPKNDPIFTLSQSTAECSLTLSLDGVDAALIRSDYEIFIKQFADLKLLNSGGFRLLQNRIAELLPLDYDALLYHHYGWDIAQNYIDLHPGMRLRVDFQHYQFVHVTEQKAKKGFTGGGSIYIPINSYTDNGEQFLGFGPFLSRLRTNNSGNLEEDGAGGLYDLVKVGSRKKFFRLFFPTETIPATAPERSVTIVAADTFMDLPRVMPLPPVMPVDPAKADPFISFFFRDKAMIIPEIQVFVGNEPVFVPAGTTVRQLIEQYANIPLASAGSQPDLSAFFGKAKPKRLVHTGANSTPEYRFLNFSPMPAVNNRDAYDLPLIKGDKFYF